MIGVLRVVVGVQGLMVGVQGVVVGVWGLMIGVLRVVVGVQGLMVGVQGVVVGVLGLMVGCAGSSGWCTEIDGLVLVSMKGRWICTFQLLHVHMDVRYLAIVFWWLTAVFYFLVDMCIFAKLFTCYFR